MNVENLTTMANQIGEFFSVYPDRVDGERQIVNHLQKFWEPRMRRALLEHIARTGGDGLDGIVKNAIEHYGAALWPAENSAR
jgi:formate dehydrogenase subunit delta